MEIDPRLRPTGESSGGVAETRHSYISPPESGHAENTSSDYPDPPSHFSREQHHHLVSAPSSGNNPYYNAPGALPSHALYHGGQGASSASTSPIIQGLHRIESSDPNDPYSELKRPRACEACRQLKVRCEPDPVNPNGPSCKRCGKAGRACVVTAPTRKRQKKTDSRVAELERKIDALTASLQAQGGDRLFDPIHSGPQRDEQPGRRWLGGVQSVSNGPATASTLASPVLPSPASTAGTKRRFSGEVKDSRDDGQRPPVHHRAEISQPPERTHDQTTSKRWRDGLFSLGTDSKPESEKGFVDMIERGLVDVRGASDAFDRYVNEMALQMPVVVFPPETKMEDVRRTKPVLLQAIVAVAIGVFQPDAQMPLIDDFYRIIAERVIMKGEKTLELVQAILVCCNWYIPPDNFEEIKFYQLIHLAVSIGMDIGMNQRTVTRKPLKTLKDLLGKKQFLADPDSPETRRAWVGCYFQSVQMAVTLRRVMLVRWQPYMDETLEILEKSPDALPSDKALIQWAKLGHIVEEVGVQFSSEELGSNPAFSDPKIQYTLKVFEKQLEQWRKETPPDMYCATMRQSDYIVNLLMHESALQIEPYDSIAPGKEDYHPTSTSHITAMSISLTSIQNILDMILSTDIRTLLCFPTANLARTSHAMVALVKLYSLVTSPDTKIGQVIDPASLKVEYYMDKVVEHYRAAGSRPGGRVAAKFSVVLSLLCNWFAKRKDQHYSLKEAFDGGKHLSICNIKDAAEMEKNQPTKTGQTPLHLLSEVAMGGGESTNRQSSRQSSSQPRSGYTPSDSIQSSSDLQQPLGTATTAPTTDSEAWVQYPPVPISSASHAHTRPFYQQPQPQPFNTNTGYQDMSTGYTDPNNGNMLMSAPNQGIFVPELGVQMDFDPENLLALGNMLGDGFWNLTFPVDGTAGYY